MTESERIALPLIEKLIAYRDGISRSERDDRELLADACNTISSLRSTCADLRQRIAALEAEPLTRKVARRIVEDAWVRFIAIKPDYDSIDLGEMLIDQLIAVKVEEIKGDGFTYEQIDARDKIMAGAAYEQALTRAEGVIGKMCGLQSREGDAISRADALALLSALRKIGNES